MDELVHHHLNSPNHNARQLPISMVVLHYTGMESAKAALVRLCDEDAQVSAHYLIDEAGQVTQMVAEERRAWHAGKSYWHGITDINSASIGIELVNPGHLFGYRPFTEAQMGALIPLLAGITRRHNITPQNVLGHSDIAPARKEDPGELFEWERLAAVGLAVPTPKVRMHGAYDTAGAFYLALERFGYDIADGRAAVRAFQRRFRPRMIDGEVDGECAAILFELLLAS